MFNQAGSLKNITDKEKEKRDKRIELKKNDIIANMRPFSFYDKDFQSFVTRKNQECIPPKFIPFKANPIKWRSQVKMYDGMIENENARKERNQKRAEYLLSQAAFVLLVLSMINLQLSVITATPIALVSALEANPSALIAAAFASLDVFIASVIPLSL